jgi:hypothetical protein
VKIVKVVTSAPYVVLWVQVYDAYLYVQYVGGAAGLATPWDMLTMAWSPVRSALARIRSCMPGFCR